MNHRIFLYLMLLIITECSLCNGCHPNSKELHICLNIYLERDFPHIETILKGQQKGSRYGGGRVLLEGTDLQNYCRHIEGLEECYKRLLPECDTYWQLDRYSRMMKVLHATHSHLCLNSTNNLRDLLLNSVCLTRAKAVLENCSSLGFEWVKTWKEVLRMQVDPVDRCRGLNAYRSCIANKLHDVICGLEAIRIYGGLIDVWLREWCNKDSTSERDLSYLYLSAKGTG
ncbi:uncharacterized protein LOC118182092 isoform X2 [Stegodyphus dumicola]|uniref:uncharacterized protein LOC118182092 isoform X2 n=1 Tax=Stegodyphus dumicola TaxID=202533 RepID=UPI0015AD4D37|nr:uncharacterized protein LOC118182092 isoform X2 [Stegodyphus dumicola]